jgi:DNA-binding winged helix-turn-helix (wHTH) protein
MTTDPHTSCTPHLATLFPRATPPRHAPRAAYRFGSFTLDLDRGLLLAGDGTERVLRPKSFALLRLLVENAGRLLSQAAILDALWPGVFITENSVSQCISDIRRALGTEAASLLRTLSRRGYLFTPDVVQMVPAALRRNGLSENFQADFTAVSGLHSAEIALSDPRQTPLLPRGPRMADRPAA